MISEVDAEVKANKGAKTPLGKAHLAALEATLLQLKEQQRGSGRCRHDCRQPPTVTRR